MNISETEIIHNPFLRRCMDTMFDIEWDPYEFSRLIRPLSPLREATIYGIALAALRMGVQTNLVTNNQIVFHKRHMHSMQSSKEIRLYLKKMCTESPDECASPSLAEYVSAGGHVQFEKPSMSIITMALTSGQVLFALVSSDVLGESRGDRYQNDTAYYLVLITGHRPGELYVHNFAKGTKQGWFPDKYLISGICTEQSATHIDTNTLLMVNV